MTMKTINMITSPTTIFNGTPLYCTPCISVSWFQQNLFLSKSSEILDLDLTRQANAETNQARETHLTTTPGGSKPFARTALLVSSVDDLYIMDTPAVLSVLSYRQVHSLLPLHPPDRSPRPHRHRAILQQDLQVKHPG